MAGQQLITGTYSGDSGHNTSSGSFTLNVRPVHGKSVLLTFTGANLDDFDNGVGQLDVLVNGQVVVDLPAGLNHLTGSGDFDAFNLVVNFGPFDITNFMIDGQNTILFMDPTSFDHFGVVSNVMIVQGNVVLLHVSRSGGVDPDTSVRYTFSNPALTVTSLAPLDSTGNVVSVASANEPLTFTLAFTGGTGPFTCIFRFGDGERAVVAGSNGTCIATHDYDSSGTFDALATVRGASTSDFVHGHFRVTVTEV